MILETILLGFLEAPASGYDLKKAFDESVRFFWNAELSQIYPTLHRLRRKGLVVVTTEPSDKGPDRKVYARTPAGTEALQRWLTSAPMVETERFAYLAQLFFLGQVGDLDLTCRFFTRLRAHVADQLAILRAIDDHHRHEVPGYPESLDAAGVHPYLTLRCGLTRMAATVAWCDESLALLDHLEEATPIDRPEAEKRGAKRDA